MSAKAEEFFRDGWCRFGPDPVLEGWVSAALPAARATLSMAEFANWWRSAGTWFVGVHALPNNAVGAVGDGPALAGAAVDFITRHVVPGGFEWDRAQISVCLPGYPKPGAEETEAAYRYRLNRDAAHVDGLKAVGPERRRFIEEYHGFLLGIPLVEVPPGAAPFVVWKGSHRIIRDGFRAALGDVPVSQWSRTDVTEVYHALRRECFATCERIEIAARPGEAYVMHRLALHGMAPWRSAAAGGAEGRMIAYFRPSMLSPEDWLKSR